MELFRFLAWQSKRLEYDEIAFILIILATAASGIITFFMSDLFAAVMVTAGTFILSFCLAATVGSILTQWNKYKREKENEAQKIVDRLAGEVWY